MTVSVFRKILVDFTLAKMGTFRDLFKHLQSHPAAQALLEGFRPNDLYYTVLFSPTQAENVTELPLKFMWLVDNADVYRCDDSLYFLVLADATNHMVHVTNKLVPKDRDCIRKRETKEVQ